MSGRPHAAGGATGAGVHWFVAWRYLLADPQRFSRAILRFIGLGLWMVLAFGMIAAWLFPLAHPILSPFQPIPWWLLAGITVLGAGTFMAPLVGASGRASLIVALLDQGSSAMSASHPADFPAARAGLSHRPSAAPWSAVSGIVCGFATVALFGLFTFVHRPFTDPPVLEVPLAYVIGFAILAATLVVIFPFFLRWHSAHTRDRLGPRQNQPRTVGQWMALAITALLLGCLALLVIASAFGIRDFLIPASKVVGGGKLLLFGGLALVVGGFVVAFASLFHERLHQLQAGGLGIRAMNIGLLVLVVLGFLYLRSIAMAGMPVGPAALAKLPESVTFPAIIGGNMVILGLFLLTIRFFFTFFSTVSIGGVAIGSMALVIVLSVMSGFENDLRRKILGSNAHVLVTKASDKPLICTALPNLKWQRCVLDVESAFTDYREVGAKINAVPGVVASSPYLISEVVIAANNNYANVIIKGAEPETVGAIGELDENVKLENGEVDKEALQRLWPLAEDGSVIGRPAVDPNEGDNSDDDIDGDGFSDALPDDPEPMDFSGGDDADDDDADSDDADDDDADSDDADGDDADGDDADGDESDAPSGAASTADAAPDDLDGDLDGDPGDLVPIEDLPPIVTGTGDIIDIDSGDEYVRRIPPLVAILPGTLVGRELVKQINLYDGQEVKIVSPLGQDTPLGPVPRTKRFRVAGTFFTGMYEYDLKFIYVEIGALQDFLDLGDEVTGIEIRVEDPSDTSQVVAKLGEVLGPEYRIQDWKELNRSLFSALKLEKIAMFLVLAIIILVASFSIVGNLIMVVIEKAREIAVLKTLGTSDVGIMKIFITQGFFIGLVGTGIGVTLGLGACFGIQTFGLPLDPDVYYIDRLPIHIEPLSVALVFGAGIFISVIATLYPAYVAASMRPVQGLRYE